MPVDLEGLYCDLETERFLLRRIGRIAAFRLTAPWRNDPELMDGLMLTRGRPSLLRWWRRGLRSDGQRHFGHVIVPKSGGGPIGLHVVVWKHPDSPAHFHVGLPDRAWWGKDVVLEVRSRLIDHFLAHGTPRFVATIDAGNAPSIFNYRRLGFRVLGPAQTRREPGTGRRRPAVSMELRPEDWLSLRNGNTHAG